MGSSPRVRGTRVRHGGGDVSSGIIPACAGNTVTVEVKSVIVGDHPRVCGEHYKHRGSITPNPGSSPRVRGTLGAGNLPMQPYGIIPACAGNTRYRLESFPQSRDHPRVCGEHYTQATKTDEHLGSSPRVRGTPERRRRRKRRHGIIPACAGNTIWLIRVPYTARDHPRVCGEHC